MGGGRYGKGRIYIGVEKGVYSGGGGGRLDSGSVAYRC